MMYLRRICQFKSLILFILTLSFIAGIFGCAKQTKLPKPLLMNDFEPRWFKDKEIRYQRFSKEGDVLSHRFFDAVADYSVQKSEINFVVNTPSNSEFRYLTNLVSGQNYMKETFCEGKDLIHRQKEQRDHFNLPNYHEGFIPQMLDQRFNPQRIIVFGADQLIQGYFQESFFRAKIIGGILLKKCSSAEKCLDNFYEKSELVLIGVSKDDLELKTINNLSELQTKADWNKGLTTFLNNEGAFFYKESYLPTIKSYDLLNMDQAHILLKKNNKLFNGKIAGKLRNTCHDIFKNIEKAMAKKNRKTQIKELKELLGKESNYYSLCVNLVQAVDPRKDHQLQDFYNILNLPYLLAMNKNYYDCKKRQWFERTGNEKYSPINALRRSIAECNSKEFEALFDAAFSFNEKLKKQMKPYWRYISYDNVSGGSHKRIDAWVEEPNEIIHCNKELISELNKRKIIYQKKRSKDFFNIYNK